MRVSAGLITGLQAVPSRMQAVTKAGYDAVFSSELNNEPFYPLLLAAEHNPKVELFSAIAVALARSPMTMAYLAHDLNQYSRGRFVLGLGSQIEAHISKRFSMPWSHPAARMREYVLALRAIWASWYNGEKLNFRGEFYQHTLMTPMFVPAEKSFPAPRIRLGGVGALMTEVAGEVADGFIAHGFTSAAYMRAVTLPALERGLQTSGRTRAQLDILCPVMVVSGETEAVFVKNRAAVRQQLAFYGSTPAYRAVLDFHGWGALQNELNVMSKKSLWAEMSALITDDMLNTLAVVCENPAQIAGVLRSRFDGLLDHWMCTIELENTALQQQVVRELQA